LVDEEAVGLMDTPGCGAKIIHGDSALEHKLQERKVKEFKTQFSCLTYFVNVGFSSNLVVCFSISSSVCHALYAKLGFLLPLMSLFGDWIFFLL